MGWTAEHQSKSLARRRMIRDHRLESKGPSIIRLRQDGHSWANIGRMVGMSASTSQEYYGIYLGVSKKAESLPNHVSAEQKHQAWTFKALGLNSTEIGARMNAKPATVRKWLSRWSQELDDAFVAAKAAAAKDGPLKGATR